MVEIVSAHTDLRRQGVRYTGLCPFHDERSPSFSVQSEEKLYHCFGCGVGGDLFDFVIAIENVDFPTAVESLAERYGVEVKREDEDPQAEERRKARQRLTELMERTASFYSSFFGDAPEAAKAREYLAGRGLGEEILKDFGVGFAPSAWDTLLIKGQQAGYSIPELLRTGLAPKNNKGGVYDRFPARITFRIRDARGRVVGFGARATRDEQKPKYLNSAEGELFHKSEILYGIDRARGPMAKAGRAVVVEGYTDVIALHQAGFTEAVGVMGTSITEAQIAMLSATVDTIVLALDADAAGRKAMLRAQQVAAGRHLRILVVAMPAGVDPAEIATAEGGAETFRELVDAAVELPEFHIELVLAEVDPNSPQSRDKVLGDAVPVLAEVPAGATRQELVRRVAERLNVDEALVRARVEQAPDPAAATQVAKPAPEAPVVLPHSPGLLSRRERQERALLAMCIAKPDEGRACLGKLEPRLLSSPLTVRAVQWLRGHLEDPAAGLDPADRELHQLIASLALRYEPGKVGEGSIHRGFLQLELAELEDRISKTTDAETRRDLNMERSRLVARVSKAEAEEIAR